jgi:hypothetical protein
MIRIARKPAKKGPGDINFIGKSVATDYKYHVNGAANANAMIMSRTNSFENSTRMLDIDAPITFLIPTSSAFGLQQMISPYNPRHPIKLRCLQISEQHKCFPSFHKATPGSSRNSYS